ncbi:DNA alkylation repair protein [Paenarthrobacter sp. RAF9]
MTTRDLVQSIRSSIRSAADPERARGAQAYMKSDMPSWGVRVPEVRKIVKAAVREFPPKSPDELRAAVYELWRHRCCSAGPWITTCGSEGPQSRLSLQRRKGPRPACWLLLSGPI